ncbi:MAG: cupin domain-containing protein [Deltaproteobacteria bacterium]|nr:cupin domain-containing protein [Deltaproteobacteria bacterium]
MQTNTQTRIKPKAKVFSLKTPYLSAGRITSLVAETDGLWIHTKVNAEGGENAVHTHTDEDHAFVVLEGEVTFFDENGNGTVLKPYQGIIIPRGAYYRYLNTGSGNLIVLRVGAGSRCKGGEKSRIGPNGQALPGHSAENKHVEGVPIPGKFFGE